jgi:oxygen-independent coproporphyrinogen-3 oxidase
VEVNPDLSLCEGLEEYRRAGVTRLSIGVQSFDERELRVLGRRHGARDVATVIERARAAGFENISLDLMFAAPGQTLESWRRSLEAATALDVEHISTYGLTVEAGTPYAEWRRAEPGVFVEEDDEAELYALAIEMLRANGYEQYEVSNFARPGFRCAHNAGYWNDDEYVGLGMGAASWLGGVRRTNTRDMELYCSAMEAGEPIPLESEEVLTGAARLGEVVMLALRRAEGVDLAAFSRRYGEDFLTFFRPTIEEMQAAGMLVVGSTHAALTERGRFIANEVCQAFLSPLPP